MKAFDLFHKIGPRSRWVVLRANRYGPKGSAHYIASAHWFKWTAKLAADHWLLGSGRVVPAKDLELTGGE